MAPVATSVLEVGRSQKHLNKRLCYIVTSVVILVLEVASSNLTDCFFVILSHK
jgi:hypothetical protein